MRNNVNICKGKNEKPIMALGELLVDLVPGVEGMKIEDAGPVLKTASGSAGIFACAAALLDAKSGFIGKVGHDSLSRMVTDTLSKQGVDISHIIVSDEGQIGLAFLEYLEEGRNYQYYRKFSAGSSLCAEELDEEYISSAGIVHYPGMLLELTPEMRCACNRLVEIAAKHNIPVSFDPNIRLELVADVDSCNRLLNAVKNADIIEPTLSEAEMITGEKTIGNILRALHAMGPKVIALTRDKDGVVLSCDGKVVFADGIDVNPVDPTGAGDTLAAALCVGLQENMPLEKLAAFCNCAGTLTVIRKGAIGMALPKRAEVDQLMNSGKCVVKIDQLENIK